MASSLPNWLNFSYCGPAASTATLEGATIKLDPKDFVNADFVKTVPAGHGMGSSENLSCKSENLSCLPSISSAALAVEELPVRPSTAPECQGSPVEVAPTAQGVLARDPEEKLLGQEADPKSEAEQESIAEAAEDMVANVVTSAREFLQEAAKSMRSSFSFNDPSSGAVSVADLHDQNEELDTSEAVPDVEVHELGEASMRHLEAAQEASDLEDPELVRESSELARANAHLQQIEEELRAHREMIAKEAQARQGLEEALAAERNRAEVAVQGRRKLEEEIEAEKQRVEDEQRRIREAEEEALRQEEQRRLEEELEVARRRAEEEARLAAQRLQDQQRLAERQRQHQELEIQARESAAEAKQNREKRQQAKAFLAAEGFRHVRASAKYSPVGTYPLHRAVQRNDAEMVRLLLWLGAEKQRTNLVGQTALKLARWKNSGGSHESVITALTEGSDEPSMVHLTSDGS